MKELQKKGYVDDLEKSTVGNENFREVIYTASNCQLVLMSLLPGEEIGMEVHDEGDQFFKFESGEGKLVINGTEHSVTAGYGVIVPMGAEHNVINTSSSVDLKLYTIYTPPHHKDKVLRKTRDEAIADGPEFDGVTTE